MQSSTGVLVTRPREQSVSLLSLLSTIGVTAIPFPLIWIEPVDLDQEGKAVVMDLDLYDKVIFISRNAVRYGMTQIDHYWPQLPAAVKWIAVGPGTGQDLRSHGVEVLVPEQAATEGLLELPELQALSNQRVLIVRGRGGREKLAMVLNQRGARTRYLEVYQRQEEGWTDEDLRRITDQYQNLIVLISSAIALQGLDDLITDQRHRIKLVVSSQRLVDMAKTMDYQQIKLASSATDEMMVSCLKGYLQG